MPELPWQPLWGTHTQARLHTDCKHSVGSVNNQSFNSGQKWGARTGKPRYLREREKGWDTGRTAGKLETQTNKMEIWKGRNLERKRVKRWQMGEELGSWWERGRKSETGKRRRKTERNGMRGENWRKRSKWRERVKMCKAGQKWG